MRKCLVVAVAVLAALCFMAPGHASAQGIFLGAGASFPMGDYGEYADAGYLAEAGISYPINENGLMVFFDGLYGSNSHGDSEDHKTNLLGGLGGVELSLAGDGEAGPFIFGEVGFLRHQFKTNEYDESETGIAFGAGAGYDIPLTETLNGYVLGRYLRGQFDEGNTDFIAVMAGVSFSIGG